MSKLVRFKKGTLKHFQEYIRYKIEKRGFDDETVHERMLLLVEEVGELAKACRKITGMNIDTHRRITFEVGQEVVDVINLIFAVGEVLGLDIEKEFLRKEKVIDKRFYKRGKKKVPSVE
jgi:NTP pyrophosphatase (non-canonical NTP hydrolase)